MDNCSWVKWTKWVINLFIYTFIRKITNKKIVILKVSSISLWVFTCTFDIHGLVAIRATFWVKQHSCLKQSVITAIKTVWDRVLFGTAYEEIPENLSLRCDIMFSQHWQWRWRGVPEARVEAETKRLVQGPLRLHSMYAIQPGRPDIIYQRDQLGSTLITTELIELTFNVLEYFYHLREPRWSWK